MKIIVDQLAIEYRDEGAGPVMLMLHGWQDNLRTFDALAAELTRSWRVVRLDLPGFGASELPKTPWRLDDYVRLVQAFCDKLRITPAVLVGHSLGGRITIKGVASGVLKPKKIVLVASAGLAKSGSRRNHAFKIVAKTGKILTLVPPLVFWRRRLRQKLYRSAGSDFLTAGPLKNTFLNIITEDLSACAARLQLPVLLVWGDRDTQTPMADGKILHGLISGSHLKVVAGAGHFVHQEQPGAVVAAVREFVAQ